jgi:dihydrofolate reductase
LYRPAGRHVEWSPSRYRGQRAHRRAAAVGKLKAKPAGEVQVHGSGSLVRWLFDNQLVDEMILLTYPVVIGQGALLFPDTGRDTALALVDSRATPGGVTIQVYRPAGRPQYANPAD